MLLSSKLLAIVIICLVSLALPAAPAQAAESARITLDPDSGIPGTNVTVRGYNFTADEEADIYYCLTAACTGAGRVLVAGDVETRAGNFTARFTVPESYRGDHQVRVYMGTGIEAAANFTVKPGLTINPKQGPVGTNVTVKGRGFARDETRIRLRYRLDGNSTIVADNITADENGSWQRVIQIPPSARGSHILYAERRDPDPQPVENATFEVVPWMTLDRSSGTPGEKVTAAGSGFNANERDIGIFFGAQEAQTTPQIIRANATGQWQASFDVPEMPKGTYNVTAEGEDTQRRDVNKWTFRIEPVLVLPAGGGHVGMNLTVIGKGFAANKDVDIKYDGNKVATNRTNTRGSFNVTFELPESQSGQRQVIAEVDGGVEATGILIMESEPPATPEIVSPAHRSRLGIIGKARPTFSWLPVFDPSGVRYDLQIATTDNVTAGGFASPIISKTRITATNYTLNETEALPYGTYYWIVRAVDRAGNAGRWTGPYFFRVGFMPLWAFIVSIVGLVVVIALLVYFFVVRRRRYYY